MKTPAPKENSNSSKSSQPSFNKSVEGSFFSTAKEVDQVFFSPKTLFRKSPANADFSLGNNTANHSFSTPTTIIQPKLTISEPGDQYEQEADAMAEWVMRMPNTLPVEDEKQIQRKEVLGGSAWGSQALIVQRKCAACEEEEKVQREEMEEEEPIQTKPLMRKAEGGGYTVSPQLTSQLNSSKGGGDPLPGQILASMNQVFGADFASVRIHTDGQAAEMSQGIQAKAFTHGSDIYFNRGQYSPESGEGKRLLGHELTHVVQQNSAFLSGEAVPYLQKQAASSTITNIQITPGIKYHVTKDDMKQGSQDNIWEHIAKNHGMHPAKLKLFNLLITVLTVDTLIRIPSPDELTFIAFLKKHKSVAEATKHFTAFLASDNVKIIRSARKRASGEMGRRYAVDSDPNGEDNFFYSQNPNLSGRTRPQMIDGIKEFKIDWDVFNKCNVFMHENVYAAGFQTPLSSNKHYVTAGTLHLYPKFYKQVSASDAKPGTLIQFFHGTGFNESHNLILTSFVYRTKIGTANNNEKMTFETIAAEGYGAEELNRDFTVEPQGQGFKILSGEGRAGYIIRFFEPIRHR